MKRTNIILGASGRVGFALVEALSKNGYPVKAVLRNPQKTNLFEDKGIEVCIADFFNPEELKAAFEDGGTVFLITPENPASQNVLDDTRRILQNCRDAIIASGIRKIVGLSSMGAQYPFGTGNLEQSYMLEHTFTDLPLEQTFIRPAYYFSNWLGYWDTAKDYGVLPTFLPADLKIPMVSPSDVAAFAAQLMVMKEPCKPVYEIAARERYSSADVVTVFSRKLQRDVEVQPIPREQWEATFQQIGFSENATANFIKMTETLTDGRSMPENPSEVIAMPTSLEGFFENI